MRGNGRIFQRRGSAAWWIAYNHRGREIRESSGGTDRKAAERLLKLRLKETGADRLGLRAFVGPAGERVLVGELLSALEADLRLRNIRSIGKTLSHMKPIRAEFEGLRAVQVTAETVDRYIESRKGQGASVATCNRETALLGQAFKLAVARGQLSAAPKIRKLKETNVRQGFFEAADFARVVQNLPEDLRAFARFAYLSGWRKGEIASLLWKDVDRNAKIIRLRPEHSKNGEGRVLALEGELWTVIEQQWQVRQYRRPDGTDALSSLMFHRQGGRVKEFRKSWATACKLAGVPERVFHDLRRTAVRNMVRAGVPERVAMSVSGHKTRAIFDRYNIVSETDIREAVTRTQRYLEAAAAEQQKVVSFKSK